MSELHSRILISSMGIVVLIAFLALSSIPWFHPIFGLGLAVVASIGLWEFYQLAKRRGTDPLFIWGIVGGVVYLFARYAHIEWLPKFTFLPGFGLALACLGLFINALFRREGAIVNVAVSLFGVIYIAVPLGFVLDLLYASEEKGLCWLIFVLVVTVVTDMVAYFTGRSLGRRSLWPAISPGKTVEGSLGGFVVGCLVGFLMLLLCLPDLAFWEMALLAVALPLIGQVADLFESVLKRDAQIKDSGFLPGLGGVLDVLDSLFFNIPLTFFIQQLFAAGVAR